VVILVPADTGRPLRHREPPLQPEVDRVNGLRGYLTLTLTLTLRLTPQGITLTLTLTLTPRVNPNPNQS